MHETVASKLQTLSANSETLLKAPGRTFIIDFAPATCECAKRRGTSHVLLPSPHARGDACAAAGSQRRHVPEKTSQRRALVMSQPREVIVAAHTSPHGCPRRCKPSSSPSHACVRPRFRLSLDAANRTRSPPPPAQLWRFGHGAAQIRGGPAPTLATGARANDTGRTASHEILSSVCTTERARVHPGAITACPAARHSDRSQHRLSHTAARSGCIPARKIAARVKHARRPMRRAIGKRQTKKDYL
jgi:hypothetical protein